MGGVIQGKKRMEKKTATVPGGPTPANCSPDMAKAGAEVHDGGGGGAGGHVGLNPDDGVDLLVAEHLGAVGAQHCQHVADLRPGACSCSGIRLTNTRTGWVGGWVAGMASFSGA